MCKSPEGAVIKNHGGERSGKDVVEQQQVTVVPLERKLLPILFGSGFSGLGIAELLLLNTFYRGNLSGNDT